MPQTFSNQVNQHMLLLVHSSTLSNTAKQAQPTGEHAPSSVWIYNFPFSTCSNLKSWKFKNGQPFALGTFISTFAFSGLKINDLGRCKADQSLHVLVYKEAGRISIFLSRSSLSIFFVSSTPNHFYFVLGFPNWMFPDLTFGKLKIGKPWVYTYILRYWRHLSLFLSRPFFWL